VSEERRCPVCGEGILRDLSHDAASGGQQQPESRQLETYTCGHEVLGDRLDRADTHTLDVEQRASDETVEPPPGPGGGG
jgi:hypothetical protein